MAKFEYTPGPWRKDTSAPFNIRDCHSRPVATCAVYLGPNIEEANARLIAAAPDMFNVLRMIDKLAGETPFTGRLHYAVVAARTLMARIEGESL